MAGVHEFGLPRVSLQPGDHVCALVVGQKQRDAVLVPYVRQGILSGDKCIVAIDELDAKDFLNRVRPDTSIDGIPPGQIDIQTSTDSALNRGRFSLDADEFIRYEAELNRFVTTADDSSMLCIYDLNQFGGDVLTLLVATYPKIMIADMPFENPYYLGPDEYVEARRNVLTRPEMPGPRQSYAS